MSLIFGLESLSSANERDHTIYEKRSVKAKDKAESRQSETI